MANLRLTLSCGDYDRTRFLIDGKVATPGLDLDVIPLVSQERHARFSRNLEFDVCELQMGVYLGWKSRGVPVTAIPVFPHVKFCHGAVVVHSGSGIESPGDLRGSAWDSRPISTPSPCGCAACSSTSTGCPRTRCVG